MWIKASASNSSGNCVEFKRVEDVVWVRDSKQPNGDMLIFTRDEIAAMLDGAKKGEFDHLLEA